MVSTSPHNKVLKPEYENIENLLNTILGITDASYWWRSCLPGFWSYTIYHPLQCIRIRFEFYGLRTESCKRLQQN